MPSGWSEEPMRLWEVLLEGGASCPGFSGWPQAQHSAPGTPSHVSRLRPSAVLTVPCVSQPVWGGRVGQGTRVCSDSASSQACTRGSRNAASRNPRGLGMGRARNKYLIAQERRIWGVETKGSIPEAEHRRERGRRGEERQRRRGLGGLRSPSAWGLPRGVAQAAPLLALGVRGRPL